MFTEVTAPGRIAAPSTGLVVSAESVRSEVDGPDDWAFGFRWRPNRRIVAGTYDPCGELGPRPTPPDRTLVHVRPVGYYVEDECGMVAGGPDESQVRAHLDARASYEAAHELWTGEVSDLTPYEVGLDEGNVNPRLAAPTADVIGTGLNVRTAIGALEQAARDASGGQTVMIHVPIVAIAALDGLRRVGNLLLTQTDAIVVADAGYPGTGPAGEAASLTTVWAYATGPVGTRFGEPSVPTVRESLDRRTNRRIARADRLFAVAFDPNVHYAASINLPSAAV